LETILVTGGCGYIGSHICVSLLIDKKNDILIIDSLVNSYKETYSKIKKIFEDKGINCTERIRFVEGDLRDKIFLDNIFYEYSKTKRPIKSVIHLAGLKSIESSLMFPLEYWESNVSSTIALLAIMQKYNCYSIIFSSSATIYKTNFLKSVSEKDLLDPCTPYGKTKLAIEEILKDLFFRGKTKIWRIANLRYFNPVGAHKSGLLGENPKGKSTNLFPAIIQAIKSKEKKLLIYGDNWPTKDGTCIRDFIHVMDLADAHMATLNFLKSNKPQLVSLNIGTGIGTSILEVVNTFLKISDYKFSFEFKDRRLGDQPYVVANNKLALEYLDWSPKRDLLEMCLDSLNS